MSIRIHPSAEVSPQAKIGEGSNIWNRAQIRENVTLGTNCTIGTGVYLDQGVRAGNKVKIQNYVSVYNGVILEDGVFIGPHTCFTNDLQPRAINPDKTLKKDTDWTVNETLVRNGASIGANATILCGITIGQWAMIGVGAVVTRDVPDHGLAYGNPARIHGFVCRCGEKLTRTDGNIATGNGEKSVDVLMVCIECKEEILIPAADYALLIEQQR